MEYKIEFTDKEITPWSGILLLIKMLDKIMTSIWCGANRFEHTEVMRQDEVTQKIE